MYEPPPGHGVVFETSHRGEATELRFVLSRWESVRSFSSFGWLADHRSSQSAVQANEEISAYRASTRAEDGPPSRQFMAF